MKLIFGSDHGGFSLKEKIILEINSKKKDDSSLWGKFKTNSSETSNFKNNDLKANSSIEIIDLGCFSDASANYPQYADLVCNELKKSISEDNLFQDSLNLNTIGVLICGSGQGMSMRANKFNFVRAALVWNQEIAKLSREHNNANIICLPGRFISLDISLDCLYTFITTNFAGGRHIPRVEKIHSSI